MANDDVSDFISAVDSYVPSIPEAVIRYYLHKGGLTVMDDRVVKAVSLATDKFLAGLMKNNYCVCV